MKKVIIIANQFAPLGGSGVQRSVKFVKHLRSFGYEPIVFTRTTEKASLKDETLLKDIPENTKIVRTKSCEPSEIKKPFWIIGKVISKLLIPDSSIIWAIKSKKELINLIKRENVNLIYTTSAPYSAHILGYKIKKRLHNIKWVADFRDEWTNNPYTLDNPHNFLRTKIEKILEKNVLKKADFLITNTPIMKENFIKNNKELNLEEKFAVIPNGYDEEDFYNLDTSKRNNKKFTMTYTGALYGRRKPDNFFIAIKNLKDKNKLNPKKVRINLVGNYHKNKLQKTIDNLGLTNEIKIIGYVPHNECIKYQLNSDVLILIEGSGVGSNAFYTGKVFEYMNTNRPVIGILPEGVAKDIIIKTNIGVVANTDSVAEIENAIYNYYKLWEDNNLNFNPNKNIIKLYERKNLTMQLSDIFTKIYI